MQTKLNKSPIHERTGLIYGGFWVRLCAKMVDWIICSILIAVLPLPMSDNSNVIIVSSQFNPYMSFIKWCIPALYTTIFLANYQATPGKMAFSLQVIPSNQSKLTYGTALARFFTEMISAFLLFIGYLLAIFDIKKRTLHDRICQTYVVQTRQVVFPNVHSVNVTPEKETYDTYPPGLSKNIYDSNIYGLHTVLFSLLILESLFSTAYCLLSDPLFRMVTWILNCVISVFLMIAIFRQHYPHFSFAIGRLTWGICIYYFVLPPIIYFLIFLIKIEQFLQELPLVTNDPVMFVMQLILAITRFVFVFSWPQMLISIIFIPCSLILGLYGIILISISKSEK